jgi:adenylosuccinate lyase
MKSIFSEDNRLLTQIQVEAALAEAHADIGHIPEAAAAEIAAKANLECTRPQRIREIEAETKHDIMAVVRALSEQCGEAGAYVHLGATSNDIIDTASALQLKQALDIIEADIDELVATLAKLAKKHRDTIMAGRTHGQWAIPTTFGFKMAGWCAEMMRYQERVQEVRKRVCVGKMSGAIGTGAAMGEDALELQERLMASLGLGYELAATQVVCRDRYAELVCLMSMLATSCERYATEIRNLQRSEIMEVAEAFDAKKQVGSSTMAQKRNPVVSENVCGLARIVRSFINPALENMVLWHERDLTNSSAERFILPHVMVLTDEILAKMDSVLRQLRVFPENMRRNLDAAQGMIMAEPVMMALTSKGMGRQEAHEVLRTASLESEGKGAGLKQTLLRDKRVKGLMTRKELDDVMDPSNYLGKTGEVVDIVVAEASPARRKASK